MAYPCVHGHCCSSCHLLSVVSGPKVSSSTVTFCPSQDLLCPTTMVCSSSSADDIRPSSAGCMWARTRVTGTGWEMAVDTGVMEPKGHEESCRDDENTARVMEDNQKKGQLHQVACGSLACSHAPSSYISFFHTWLGLPLPPHPFFSVVHSLSSPLLAPSPLLALLLRWLQAMLSVPPAHSVMEGWFVEWRRDEAMEAFSTRKNFLPLAAITLPKYQF